MQLSAGAKLRWLLGGARRREHDDYYLVSYFVESVDDVENLSLVGERAVWRQRVFGPCPVWTETVIFSLVHSCPLRIR